MGNKSKMKIASDLFFVSSIVKIVIILGILKRERLYFHIGAKKFIWGGQTFCFEFVPKKEATNFLADPWDRTALKSYTH